MGLHLHHRLVCDAPVQLLRRLQLSDVRVGDLREHRERYGQLPRLRHRVSGLPGWVLCKVFRRSLQLLPIGLSRLSLLAQLMRRTAAGLHIPVPCSTAQRSWKQATLLYQPVRESIW